jgi:hypothetical protein
VIAGLLACACGAMISVTTTAAAAAADASFWPAEEDEERVVGQADSSGMTLGCIQCRLDWCFIAFLDRVSEKLAGWSCMARWPTCRGLGIGESVVVGSILLPCPAFGKGEEESSLNQENDQLTRRPAYSLSLQTRIHVFPKKLNNKASSQKTIAIKFTFHLFLFLGRNLI